MESFGDIIKKARENNGFFLRQVGSALELDQAIISKFERGERKPTKEQVEKFATFFRLDKSKLITAWLSDKIAYSLIGELNPIEILKVAEDKIIYFQTHNG